MEQSEKSIPDTETEADFKGIKDRDDLAYKVALDIYFRKPEMVKFLMTDNLALKLLLREKGLITAEELEKAKKEAAAILEAEVRRQIDDWRTRNPQQSTLLNVLATKNPDA